MQAHLLLLPPPLSVQEQHTILCEVSSLTRNLLAKVLCDFGSLDIGLEAIPPPSLQRLLWFDLCFSAPIQRLICFVRLYPLGVLDAFPRSDNPIYAYACRFLL